MRPDNNFNNLQIAISVDSQHFLISDNCGGMSLNSAKDHAFRFGRPKTAENQKGSIGQFGVGMKRAIFKIGNRFQVLSQNATEHFSVSDSINVWQSKQEWLFPISMLEIDSTSECGTKVEITELHETVSEQFNSSSFIKELAIETENAHQSALESGLSITFNGIPIKYTKTELLESEHLKPVNKEYQIEIDEEQINVRIVCGLSESSPNDAGWYIFCNGRQILRADQTNLTGWSEGSGSIMPQFHNRYGMFRGYVFFSSENTTLLPWNTTKTGIDSDSKVYQSVRQDMLSIMRPVIDFLYDLSKENSEEIQSAISNIFDKAIRKEVQKIPVHELFSYSTELKFMVQRSNESTIAYKMDNEKITAIKKSLGVHSNKDVGIKTFNYYWDMEVK